MFILKVADEAGHGRSPAGETPGRTDDGAPLYPPLESAVRDPFPDFFPVSGIAAYPIVSPLAVSFIAEIFYLYFSLA